MSEARRQPQRTCLGCREGHVQSEMVRFVRAPDGAVLVDLRKRLPGRGAYCCWNRSCFEQAVKNRRFERAFKQACQAPTLAGLEEQVKTGLLKHMSSLIGMSRKALQVVAGSNAVIDGLKNPGRFALVLLATDISTGVGDKVRGKAAFAGIEIAELFDKAELGRMVGRSEHSVLGLQVGQLAEAFRADLHKYRNISGES